MRTVEKQIEQFIFFSRWLQMPVYLGFPKQIKYNIFLQIPQGYQIETLPTSINLTTGENIAFFK